MTRVLAIIAAFALTACGSETDQGADVPAEDTSPIETTAAAVDASLEEAAQAASSDDTGSTGVRGAIQIGNPDAPIVIEEYASLTCPACGAFHTLVYPEVKEKLIDSGRVQFKFYNYVLGGRLDLGASVIARCSTPEVAEKLLATLFQRQQQWARSQDVVGELASIARVYGINRVQFDKCLQDQDMARHLIDMTKEANERGVTSTPTLFVNGNKLDNFAFETILKAVEAEE